MCVLSNKVMGNNFNVFLIFYPKNLSLITSSWCVYSYFLAVFEKQTKISFKKYVDKGLFVLIFCLIVNRYCQPTFSVRFFSVYFIYTTDIRRIESVCSMRDFFWPKEFAPDPICKKYRKWSTKYPLPPELGSSFTTVETRTNA